MPGLRVQNTYSNTRLTHYAYRKEDIFMIKDGRERWQVRTRRHEAIALFEHYEGSMLLND